MNSEAVQALIAKNPSLKAAKTKLEAMEPGAYCVHRSWGFGQIQEYDETDQKLLIDFKGKAKHRMDPAFCVRTLDVLPPKHLLVRKETEPEKIAQLIDEKPVQLVVETLAAFPNKVAASLPYRRAIALPATRASTSPIFPQPHSAWSLSETNMWPAWPALPFLPRNSRPSTHKPMPIPVLQVT